MEANKILSADILDLIFEDRNKDYGAYELRKTYNRRITRALIITASIALLALLGSVLASTINSSNNKKVKIAGNNPAGYKAGRKERRTTSTTPAKAGTSQSGNETIHSSCN